MSTARWVKTLTADLPPEEAARHTVLLTMLDNGYHKGCKVPRPKRGTPPKNQNTKLAKLFSQRTGSQKLNMNRGQANLENSAVDRTKKRRIFQALVSLALKNLTREQLTEDYITSLFEDKKKPTSIIEEIDEDRQMAMLAEIADNVIPGNRGGTSAIRADMTIDAMLSEDDAPDETTQAPDQLIPDGPNANPLPAFAV